jgi:penicillin-binding protein 1B
MPSNKQKSSAAVKSKSRLTKKVTADKKPVRSRRKTKRSTTRSKTWSKRAVVFALIPGSLLAFLFYLVFLDQRITQRFEGRIWQLPAHVYARPLELYIGKSISTEQLSFELNYLNYQKVEQLPQKSAEYRHWQNIFEIKTRDFIFWDGKEPAHTIRVKIENNKVVELINIYSNSNADLVRFDAGYLTGIFPSHSQDRVLLKLDEVPDIFIKMLLLIEDRRYFSHLGIDPRSIARALVINLSSGQTSW